MMQHSVMKTRPRAHMRTSESGSLHHHCASANTPARRSVTDCHDDGLRAQLVRLSVLSLEDETVRVGTVDGVCGLRCRVDGK